MALVFQSIILRSFHDRIHRIGKLSPRDQGYRCLHLGTLQELHVHTNPKLVLMFLRRWTFRLDFLEQLAELSRCFYWDSKQSRRSRLVNSSRERLNSPLQQRSAASSVFLALQLRHLRWITIFCSFWISHSCTSSSWCPWWTSLGVKRPEFNAHQLG